MQTLRNWLQNLDHDHTVVLTPHHYLAEHLQTIANEQSDQSTWRLPTIISFGAWLKQIWPRFVLEFGQILPALILNSHSLFIWHDVIQKQLAGQEMVSAWDLAQLAQTARGLLNYWEVDYNPRASELNLDQQRFYIWLAEYKARLNQLNWIDEADLLPFLIQHSAVLKKIISKHTKIIFYAFSDSEHSPATRRLFHSLKDICQVTMQAALPISTQITTAKLYTAANSQNEILAMAQWVHQQHRENPEAHIACIIPKLSQQLPALETIFKGTFQLDPLSDEYVPYSFALKRSLFSIPMMNMAFNFFSLLRYPRYTKDEVCHLLRTSFIRGAETEFSARSNLEATILQSIKKEWSWDELYELALQYECQEWVKILLTLQQAIEVTRRQKKTIRQWAEFLSQLLGQLGWPGERISNPLEVKMINHWLSLFDQWVEMDFLLENLNSKKTDIYQFSYQEALDSLLQLAKQKAVVTNDNNIKVHIISLNDAWGMSFDKVWIMGMEEAALPLSAAPHPFLLSSVQINYAMPHSCAEKEMEYAHEYWQQLCLINPCVIASYAKIQSDVTALPCRFIQNIPSITLDFGMAYQGSRINLEESQDSETSCLSAIEAVKGGSAILKYQAECPFKAFAYHRLKALPIELDISEIDSRRRGIFIHRALEILWEELQHLSYLKSLTTEEIESLTEKVVVKAMQIKETTDLPQALLICEKSRIKKLLLEWVEVEKIRAPFQVVAAEFSREVELAGLHFKLRIDRIDQLENGQKVLIDYKTGQPSANDWFGERPTEPQLPLYVVASDDQEVAGIAFAQVKVGSCAYRGVAPEKTIPGCYSLERYTKEDYSWSDQKEIWQNELFNLADDFRQGRAKVDPKEGGKTCQTCQLQSLCRVKEGSR